MPATLVSTHLLRLECPAVQCAVSTPAAAITPRGGREVYLMLLDQPPGVMPGRMVLADTHAVADEDDAHRSMADVLIARRPAEVLARRPGCRLAIGPSASQRLLAVRRDGGLIQISCTAGTAAFYGSLLYTWTTAGLPLGELDVLVSTGASSVAGRAWIRPLRDGGS